MHWRSLLNAWRRPVALPRLTAIFVSPRAGAPMQSLESALAVAGQGLAGDRYSEGTGHWHPVESCEVTLISEDDLDRAGRRIPVALDRGEHRRNLVITGITTDLPEDGSFRIGEARFEYWKPRPPCGYINQVTGNNMAKALGRNSGVCLRVLETGKIRVGDSLIRDT